MESAGTVLGFVVVVVWQKRLVIVIDIYPVRQTHPGKLNDGLRISILICDHRRYIFILI
jgi:hypothetical protein